jgi:cysteinyl-tRNA synthetase
MLPGFRIGIDDRKETPMDFALWKASKPGEPAWDSPWGKGRPGWHIECSAMNLHHLGEQIDIHGGGNDLVFPHHENEIAQTECLTGKQFARYWVHNGMMQLGGEKMSKSLGNLVTVEEFLNTYDAEAFRMLILNASYRSPLTYNDEVMGHAQRALERLRSALRPALPDAIGAPADLLQSQMEVTEQGFLSSMDDDFNTAGALGHIFDLVRAINHARDSGVSAEDLEAAQALLIHLTGVLGLRIERGPEGGEAGPFIDLLVEVRNELRRQKLWELSDRIREQLTELGVILEDAKEGSSWRWK